MALHKASQTPPHAPISACAVPAGQQPPQSSGAASRARRRANAAGRSRLRRRAARQGVSISAYPRIRSPAKAAQRQHEATYPEAGRTVGAALARRSGRRCAFVLSALALRRRASLRVRQPCVAARRRPWAAAFPPALIARAPSWCACARFGALAGAPLPGPPCSAASGRRSLRCALWPRLSLALPRLRCSAIFVLPAGARFAPRPARRASMLGRVLGLLRPSARRLAPSPPRAPPPPSGLRPLCGNFSGGAGVRSRAPLRGRCGWRRALPRRCLWGLASAPLRCAGSAPCRAPRSLLRARAGRLARAPARYCRRKGKERLLSPPTRFCPLFLIPSNRFWQ